MGETASGRKGCRETAVTEQEKYLFDLQGFLVVENALDGDHIAALNAILDERIAADVLPDATSHRWGRLLTWGEPYRRLTDNPNISPYLDELLGDRFRLDHDYADLIRSGKGPIGTRLHGGATPFDPAQYYHCHNGRLHNGLTVVAYSLRDVDPALGGFACVPGSHKSNFRFPEEWRELEQDHPFVARVGGPAGTAILFTEALTHGTLPWNAPGERRTVFFKYCPHPLAWSRRYYDVESYEGLTARERSILGVPGVYPRDDRPQIGEAADGRRLTESGVRPRTDRYV